MERVCVCARVPPTSATHIAHRRSCRTRPGRLPKTHTQVARPGMHAGTIAGFQNYSWARIRSALAGARCAAPCLCRQAAPPAALATMRRLCAQAAQPITHSMHIQTHSMHIHSQHAHSLTACTFRHTRSSRPTAAASQVVAVRRDGPAHHAPQEQQSTKRLSKPLHLDQYTRNCDTHLTVPSAEPVTMWSPSALMATPRTSPVWPVSVVMHSKHCSGLGMHKHGCTVGAKHCSGLGMHKQGALWTTWQPYSL